MTNQGTRKKEFGSVAAVFADAGGVHTQIPEPRSRNSPNLARADRLAKEMREADKRGKDLGFTTEELAFYDALEVNDSCQSRRLICIIICFTSIYLRSKSFSY
jgi:Domain of unknown function (DUF3387)